MRQTQRCRQYADDLLAWSDLVRQIGPAALTKAPVAARRGHIAEFTLGPDAETPSPTHQRPAADPHYCSDIVPGVTVLAQPMDGPSQQLKRSFWQ